MISPCTVNNTGNRFEPSEMAKSPNTSSSSPSISGSTPLSRSRADSVPTFFHHAMKVIVAKLVEAADAKNSGASQVVSLHSGWLVALSKAPG